AAHRAIRHPSHNDQRGHEADHLEVPAQFVRVPDLAVLGFHGLAAARLDVDLDQPLSSKDLRGVVHLLFLSCLGDARPGIEESAYLASLSAQGSLSSRRRALMALRSHLPVRETCATALGPC